MKSTPLSVSRDTIDIHSYQVMCLLRTIMECDYPPTHCITLYCSSAYGVTTLSLPLSTTCSPLSTFLSRRLPLQDLTMPKVLDQILAKHHLGSGMHVAKFLSFPEMAMAIGLIVQPKTCCCHVSHPRKLCHNRESTHQASPHIIISRSRRPQKLPP